MHNGPQRIVKIRRAYNRWVGDETLEDYALRFTARSFRKWSELRIANTALGGISFLALEAIGAERTERYELGRYQGRRVVHLIYRITREAFWNSPLA